MPHLLGSHPKHTALVQEILKQPALADRADLAAGLWLYVDDLDRSHTVSQSVEDTTGSYWHGIMHRREGDFSNSHYWMRRAAGHPLPRTRPDLDPDALIDDPDGLTWGASLTDVVGQAFREISTRQIHADGSRDH